MKAIIVALRRIDAALAKACATVVSLVAGVSHEASEQTLGQATTGVDMLQNSLDRAAQLISSFKDTAVNQVDDSLSDFKVMDTVRNLQVSLQPVMRRVHGGTGLSRNTVKTLVTQRPGGRLEFWSDSAAGLCFRLDLPWWAPATPTAAQEDTT